MASSLNGTGLTFSSGATLNSPPVTSVATSGGVTGGTITTTGTVSLDTNNTFGVGSTQWLYSTYGSFVTAGSTLSGSYLYYYSSMGANYYVYSLSPGGGQLMSPSNVVNGTAASYTYNSGANAYTMSQVGGTWRALTFFIRAGYNPCYGGTFFGAGLWIRVS